MLSYVNILCWKTLNNNFQHNSIYRHLIKTSKILTNYIIWNLPVSTGFINIWWTINMLTSLQQWNHCVGMSMKRNTTLKNYVQTKHCVEMSTQRKWLIDTNLSVDCRNLSLLDCSKKPIIWTWVAKPLQIAKFQYYKFVEDSSWFNIH